MGLSFGELKDHNYADFASDPSDAELIYSGDANAGSDNILLSGDAQDNGDQLLLSGDGLLPDLAHFASFFDTGWMTRGEGHKDFTNHYMTVYSRAVEDFVTDNAGNFVLTADDERITDSLESSCLLIGKWDWANDALSNMWSPSQQVYDSTDREHRFVQKRKLKIRGTGKTLQLNFTSEDGKPFHIIGWSSFDAVNQNV